MLRLLFVSFLVAGVPVLSYASARPDRIRLFPRPALYVSAVVSQCFLAGLGAAVVWITLPGFNTAGFRWLSLAGFLGWTALLTLTLLAAVCLMALLERVGWWPEESEVSYLLLPETRQEKALAALLVAPSAGFCEEFLYRGYLLPQLSQCSSSGFWGWMLSSAAFGLAHSYQGISGMLQAALLGALLALPVLRTGSVYPSMAAHFLVDAVLLVWLGRRLLRPRKTPDQPLAPGGGDAAVGAGFESSDVGNTTQ